MKPLPGSGGKGRRKQKSYNRAVVVIDFPDINSEFISFGRKLILCFKNSPYISNPSPSINKVTNDVVKLEKKEAIAKSRTIGTADSRDVAKDIVRLDIYAWAAFVQLLADNDRDHSIAIIESAGFKVKHVPIRTKQPLKAVKGDEFRSVKLLGASLGRRIAYEWEWSLDGQNWNYVFPTNMAKKTIKNLTPAVIYYFRYRGNTTVEGEWSGMVAYITL